MTGSGDETVVHYLPWRVQEYVKPAKDVSIENPVLVDLLTGNDYAVKTSTETNTLAVKDIPPTDNKHVVLK